MPGKSQSHVAYPEPNLTPAAPAREGGQPPTPTPAFTTLRLPPGWQKIYAWAVGNNVLSEILLVIDTTMTRDRPDWFGTVLEELDLASTKRLLPQWKTVEFAAEILNRISTAIQIDPSILNAHPPLPKTKSAQAQLRGELGHRYLFALLLEQIPPGTPDQKEWLSTVRLWAFVHALKRALSGNFQDEHIKEVTDKIRIASDRSDQWRRLIEEIATPTTAFDEINTFLRFIGDNHPRAKQLKPSNRLFLQSVTAVAKNIHAPISSGANFPRNDTLSAYYPTKANLPSSETNTWLDEQVEEDASPARRWQSPPLSCRATDRPAG